MDPIIAVADQTRPRMATSPISEKPVAMPSTALSRLSRPSSSESGSARKISSTTSARRRSSVRSRPLIETSRMASGKIETST